MEVNGGVSGFGLKGGEAPKPPAARAEFRAKAAIEGQPGHRPQPVEETMSPAPSRIRPRGSIVNIVV
ncbi:MAG: hypothetical protein HY521_09710 [Proteobacteria bacterium]|nr:hypothetical protein [Pseudomonadota bacterium]